MERVRPPNRIDVLAEVCRLIGIRDQNIRKAQAKGHFDSPGARALLKEADGGPAEHIRMNKLTLDEIVVAYAAGSFPPLTRDEIARHYKEILENTDES